MENAERLVNKTAEIHEFASEVARMITGAQMPEFSSENISVADASKLIGLPATSIRAGKDKDVIVNLTIKADSETLYKVVRKGQKKYDNRYHVVATI